MDTRIRRFHRTGTVFCAIIRRHCGRNGAVSQEDPAVDDGGCIRTIFTLATASNNQAGGWIGSTTPLALDITLIFIFVLFNAFFAGTEMAVINCNANRVRLEAESGNKVAKKFFILSKTRVDSWRPFKSVSRWPDLCHRPSRRTKSVDESHTRLTRRG